MFNSLLTLQSLTYEIKASFFYKQKTFIDPMDNFFFAYVFIVEYHTHRKKGFKIVPFNSLREQYP